MKCAGYVAPFMLLVAGNCVAPVMEGRNPEPIEEEPVNDPPRAARGGRGGSSGGAGGLTAGGGGAPPPQTGSDASATVESDAALAAADASAADGGARDPRMGPPPVAVGGPPLPCRFAHCESFEDGAEGASPNGWSRNGNIGISSARAARGTKSLRARNGGIIPGNFIARGGVFPAGKNTVYTRVFVWFERRPTAGGLVHWTLTEVRGAGGPTIRTLGGISQMGFRGRNNLMFNIDPGGGEKAVEDTFPYPIVGEKVWHCLEVMTTRGTKDEVRVWWNEEERPRLHYQGTWGSRFKFPTFEQLAIGFATYQNVGAFEVFVDELAVHDQRIGCSN